MLAKEVRAELRGRSGLLTALLFNVAAIVAASFASSAQGMPAFGIAAMLWVILLFAAVVALPRAFLVEEEQGTGDLLRLWARPHSVFWGKALYNLGLMLLTGALLSALYLLLSGQTVERPALYVACLLGGCAALAGSTTLCGAFVAQASNRFALAGAVALPLLVPLLAVTVTGTASAFGAGSAESAERAAAGLWAYAVATFAMGPYLFAAVWKS